MSTTLSSQFYRISLSTFSPVNIFLYFIYCLSNLDNKVVIIKKNKMTWRNKPIFVMMTHGHQHLNNVRQIPITMWLLPHQDSFQHATTGCDENKPQMSSNVILDTYKVALILILINMQVKDRTRLDLNYAPSWWYPSYGMINVFGIPQPTARTRLILDFPHPYHCSPSKHVSLVRY